MKYNNITQTHIKKGKKVHSGPFCFLIWLLKVEFIILVTFFIINFSSNLVSDKTKFIIKYNIEKTFCNTIKPENYSIEDIFKSLDENKNLSSEEKTFIKENLKDEITENFEYIDAKLLIKRLKSLENSYHKKYKYDERKNEYILQNSNIYLRKIGGYYNSIFNEINIYEQKENNKISSAYNKEIFDFSKCDKRVYFHELNHLATKNTLITLADSFIQNLENNKNNIFLKSTQPIDKEIFLEPINEIFTLEYLQNNEQYVFSDNMIYVYIFAEILPEDVIRKYKFYDNQSILVSGLLDIDNNIDKVYELFYSINKVCKNEGSKGDFQNIHDGYANFYRKRFNKEMSEDLEVLLYLYGTDIQTNEERTFIRNYLNMENSDEILKIIPKGYFSENYKTKHNKIYVEFSQNGTIKKDSI